MFISERGLAMATRKSRNSTRSHTSRASADVDARVQQEAAQQQTHRQMQLAVDTTAAVLRGAEIWTQLQLHALKRSAQSWQQAAEQLRLARGPMELMAAQNQLVMNSFVQAMQFGQDFLQATWAAQPEVTRGAREAAAAPAGVEAMAPMMQAWQNVLAPMGLNGAGATTH
jgi:hypothetical protein